MNFLKSFCLTIVLALTSLSLSAQPIDPVAWKTSVKQDAEGVYAITFSASVDKGWHIYDLGPYEGGPMATTFTFEGEGFELQGAVEASSIWRLVIMREVSILCRRLRLSRGQ